MKVKNHKKIAIRYKAGAVNFITTCLLLSACGGDGVSEDNTGQAPEIGAANESSVADESSIPVSSTDNLDSNVLVNSSITTANAVDEDNQPIALKTETTFAASTDVDTSVPDVRITEATAPEIPASEASVPETSTEQIPDTNPVVTNSPTTESENSPPHIDSTSYVCDPVTESILFSVGDSDTFTLSVTDEFPLHLEYDVDTSSSETANVAVDENGVFTISALAAGETFVWLSVSDNDGLVDEHELHVIVQ
ncbi:hypothetical protein N9383_00160 [Granulosicoccus sp.]|nr:hypothetical protein [Granulosicoccus sp.]